MHDAHDIDHVQTSALDDEPDMFAGTDAAPPAEDVYEIHGVLTASAEVRTKLTGHGVHPLPVLCMEVKPLNGLKRTIHAEKVFSEASRKEAEQLAATLKRGARITLTTSLRDMRTILPHIKSVAITPAP